MCLKAEAMTPVPEETARLAHRVCPKGNFCIWMSDELEAIFQDELFVSLFPRRGQPAEAPWRLAMVTVFQFVEGLSDRQAANAVRTRLDWKYALRLELEDLGFDFSVLSEFRKRLVTGGGSICFLKQCLRTRKHVDGSGCGGANGRIRRMCWQPSKR
jgi:transposase